MGAFKRIHPLPLAAPRRCVMRSQCDRSCLRFMPVLMDRAACSAFHQKKGTSGSARAPMRQRCAARQLTVRRSAGTLAATRQQSYGCAYSDVRWGSTSNTFNIITNITTYISHGRCRNVYASGGLCVFLAPSLRFLTAATLRQSAQQEEEWQEEVRLRAELMKVELKKREEEAAMDAWRERRRDEWLVLSRPTSLLLVPLPRRAPWRM